MTALNDFVRSHANKPISEELDTYLSRYGFPLIGEPKEVGVQQSIMSSPHSLFGWISSRVKKTVREFL